MTKIIATAQKQGMIVFDDRRGPYDHTYYINATHPNGKYFSELVRRTAALR